jgi:hypothetical protein
MFKQYYRSVPAAVEIFTTHFPIAARLKQNADAATFAAFAKDIHSMFEKQNRASDGTMVMDCEYFEGIARRA